MNKTYSFADVNVSIQHPDLGQYIADGQGIGNINVTMTTDRSTHDIAADGSIMISKVKARNGMAVFMIQQTSPLNAWLTKWYNYLELAPTDRWALTKIVIKAPTMGETITITGVSPQKLPDKPYAAQGQQIAWNLMAADVQQEAV